MFIFFFLGSPMFGAREREGEGVSCRNVCSRPFTTDCSPTYLALGVIKVKQLLEGGHNKSTDDWHPTGR
jgi:hypothetical protein